jgi:hypothetical protein
MAGVNGQGDAQMLPATLQFIIAMMPARSTRRIGIFSALFHMRNDLLECPIIDFASTSLTVPPVCPEIGIDWRTDGIRFFAVLDGAEVTLWVLSEARFIPQVPLQFCFNLWHPTTHWLPPAAPALHPAADAVMRIDWFGYWPAP